MINKKQLEQEEKNSQGTDLSLNKSLPDPLKGCGKRCCGRGKTRKSVWYCNEFNKCRDCFEKCRKSQSPHNTEKVVNRVNCADFNNSDTSVDGLGSHHTTSKIGSKTKSEMVADSEKGDTSIIDEIIEKSINKIFPLGRVTHEGYERERLYERAIITEAIKLTEQRTAERIFKELEKKIFKDGHKKDYIWVNDFEEIKSKIGGKA